MKRARLELRRFVGWVCWALIVYTPSWVSPFYLGSWTLGMAGRFAHWDYDRANWADEL